MNRSRREADDSMVQLEDEKRRTSRVQREGEEELGKVGGFSEEESDFRTDRSPCGCADCDFKTVAMSPGLSMGWKPPYKLSGHLTHTKPSRKKCVDINWSAVSRSEKVVLICLFPGGVLLYSQWIQNCSLFC